MWSKPGEIQACKPLLSPVLQPHTQPGYVTYAWLVCASTLLFPPFLPLLSSCFFSPFLCPHLTFHLLSSAYLMSTHLTSPSPLSSPPLCSHSATGKNWTSARRCGNKDTTQYPGNHITHLSTPIPVINLHTHLSPVIISDLHYTPAHI